MRKPSPEVVRGESFSHARTRVPAVRTTGQYIQRICRIAQVFNSVFQLLSPSGTRLPQRVRTGLTACFVLSLTAPVQAQSQATGTAVTPADTRTTLGNCPADLLRRAWTEEHPLEVAAVEDEVLKFCAERAEAITRELAAQARLDTALAVMRAAKAPGSVQRDIPASTPQPPSADETRIEAEIRDLKERIARLEAGPERPEDAATLTRLHRELARAESELAIARVAAATEPGEPDLPEEEQIVVPGTSPAQEERPAETTDPLAPPASDTATTETDRPIRPDRSLDSKSPLRITIYRDDAPSPDRQVDPGPAPATSSTPGQPLASPATGPASTADGTRPIRWRVIYAARAGDRPWQVRLVGETEIAVTLPPATPEGTPRIEWRPVTEGPVTLTPGDVLPDGKRLIRVTAAGVELAHEQAASGVPPQVLPLDAVRDTAPGRMAWDYRKVEAEQLDAGGAENE